MKDLTGVINDDEYFKFLENIKTDIITTRRQILSQANNEVVLMYYRIGKGLIENSKYGNRFIDTLATDLKLDFPNMQGLSARNLRYMKRFAKEFEYDSILQHNVAKLPWTTITTIMDNGKAYGYATDQIVEYARERDVDVVVGPEARGFIIGCPVAYSMGIGFAPVRKEGK